MPTSSRSPPGGGGATLKQGKLDFRSSKRTASTSNIKRAGNAAKSKNSTASLDIKEGEDTKAETEKEGARKIITPRSSLGSCKPQSQKDLTSDQEPIAEARPELNIKDPKWRKLFTDAKNKRNGLPLAHGNKEDQISQILRVFDLNYDYGPCIGVSRLERWERAHTLGLNPPLEIRDILTTRQGSEQYSQCVFQGEV
ncbi:DNA polymerase delta subunit 4 [Leucoagaricus sp. SymC.cos]|nr:DNA polymerase delta subunit 4 [Leucoagaricus sp. SymC.cos]